MKIKETDIRPDNLRSGQIAALQADVARMVSRRSEFVKVLCPACGASECNQRWEKYSLCYVECEQCKTVYVNPRPSPKILEWFYKDSENYRYFADKIFPASEAVRRENIVRPRLDRILEICERYKIQRDVMVEIGSGFGTFCEEAMISKAFEEVIAVEPTPELARACRARGINVVDKPVEQIDLAENFANVVASFEVIEHLFDPASFISACAQTMQVGGLLVLTCPNLYGFEIDVLESHSDAVDVEHLNYFHPESLSALVKKQGLEVLEIMTPGLLDVDLVRKKMDSKEFKLPADNFMHRLVCNDNEAILRNFQQFLSSNNLSSHMWLVARK